MREAFPLAILANTVQARFASACAVEFLLESTRCMKWHTVCAGIKAAITDLWPLVGHKHTLLGVMTTACMPPHTKKTHKTMLRRKPTKLSFESL